MNNISALIRNLFCFISMIILSIFGYFYAQENWNTFDFYGQLALIICLIFAMIVLSAYLFAIICETYYFLKYRL